MTLFYGAGKRLLLASVVFTQRTSKNCLKAFLTRFNRVLLFIGVINPLRVALNNL